ncbi:twin-arginine translocation pathway signal protein [Vibrio owensii]|uniref:DUF1501 domain-containing protein n=1 Tax=Vibrio owensii TaxID=696485 RepID=UPI0003AAD85F|nr:DUF1501 domain-containing protein [Vibrio owensii]SUP40889.1 twin-arginine translocation pathway signal protein [Vibrio owensii]
MTIDKQTNLTSTRRQFLKSVLAVGATSMLPNVVFAQSSSPNIFVWITLRGAMDGLNVVVPYANKQYLALRPTIGLATEKLNKLDEFYGLHPAMKTSFEWYQNKQMAMVHACATAYRERSHFDGQKVLENGTDNPLHRDGWLNRLLQLDAKSKGLAIDSGLPLIVQGEKAVSSWYPNNLQARDSQVELLEALFQSDEKLASNFEEALKIEMMSNRNRPGKQFPVLASQAGTFLSAEGGPNISVLELGGWDTHAGQGAETGRLANQLRKLDNGLANLKKALGDNWSKTVVMAASEFGRTAAENGTKGTDHGTANAIFIAGGAIEGGKVLGEFPGLVQAELYEGRDLAPANDMRAVIKAVLQQHMSIESSALESVFPDSGSDVAYAGLIRSS